MIEDPRNDVGCLRKVLEAARRHAQTPLARVLASRYPTVRELVAAIRAKPQDSEAKTFTGEVVFCDVAQHVGFWDERPNCVRRTADFLAVLQVLAPELRTSAVTIEMPRGRHTMPVIWTGKRWEPVDLSPLAGLGSPFDLLPPRPRKLTRDGCGCITPDPGWLSPAALEALAPPAARDLDEVDLENAGRTTLGILDAFGGKVLDAFGLGEVGQAIHGTWESLGALPGSERKRGKNADHQQEGPRRAQGTGERREEEGRERRPAARQGRRRGRERAHGRRGR